uniref:Ig-like domain-containing protein n=1 Tax=Marinomonas atlantica TaxID=1806668 RepID=UPI000AD1368E
YTITDGTATDSAEVTVTVDAVNDGPEAVDDTASTNEDTVVTIDVLANDTDLDGDTLTITDVSVPEAQGTVAIVDGKVQFTPADNFNGDATISYTITDGTATDSAEVTVTVDAVNDGPDAVDDTASTSEDTVVTIDVLANDTDLDGDTLTITDVSVPEAQGTVAIVDGKVQFTPAENFNGDATISYTITDGTVTDSADVTVNVTPVDDGSEITIEQDNGDKASGSLTEDNDTNSNQSGIQLSLNGTLTVTDVDGNGAFNTTPVFTSSTVDNGAQLGVLTIDDEGNWSYEVDNSNEKIQALDDGESIVETYTVSTADGNDTQTITITINGRDEVALSIPDGSELATVTEEALTGGLADDSGNTDVSDVRIVTNTFSISGPSDADLALSLGLPTTSITSGGVSVVWSKNGDDVIGMAGDTEVLRISVSDIQDGQASYTVTLSAPVDHAVTDLASEENTLDLDFEILLSDGQDTVSEVIKVVIEDDSPSASDVEDDVYLSLNSTAASEFTVANIQGGFTNVDFETTSNEDQDKSQQLDTDSDELVDKLSWDDSDGSPTELTLVDANGSSSVDVDSYVTLGNFSHHNTPISSSYVSLETTDVSYTFDVIIEGETHQVTLTADLVIDQTTNSGSASESADTVRLSNLSSQTVTVNGNEYKVSLEGFLADGFVSHTLVTEEDQTNTVQVVAKVEVVSSVDGYEQITGTVDLGSDFGADGGDLEAQTIVDSTYGTLVIAEDGSYTYQPNSTFADSIPNGGQSDASFDYQVKDADGDTVVRTLTISVHNNLPALADDSGNLLEDATLTVDAEHGLLSNDFGGDQQLAVSSFSFGGQAANADQSITLDGVGQITINSDGSYQFTPVEDWAGEVPDITYATNNGMSSILSLTVDAVADAPTLSVSIGEVSLNNDLVLTGDDIHNLGDRGDNNVNSSSDWTDSSAVRTLSFGEENAGATVTLSFDALVKGSWDLDGSNSRADTFVIKANDVQLDERNYHHTYESSTTSDALTYTATLDAQGNLDVEFLVDSTATTETVDISNIQVTLESTSDVTLYPLNISGVENDQDGSETLTFTVSGIPETAKLVNSSGVEFSKNSDGNYELSENEIDDVQLSVPNSLAGFDITVEATSTDGTSTATDSETVSITPINHDPNASDDQFNAVVGSTLTIGASSLLANDSDTDGDNLTLTSVSNAQHGHVFIGTDGNVHFTATEGFNGTASFDYTVSDDEGATGSATVSISVPAASSNAAEVDVTVTRVDSSISSDIWKGFEDGHSFNVWGDDYHEIGDRNIYFSDYRGDSDVLLEGSTWSGNSYVNTDSGDDRIEITGASSADISTGDDNDNVALGSSTNWGSDISLGEGNDSLYVNGNVTGTVDTGSGEDKVLIEGSLNSSSPLNTNSGDDIIAVRGDVNSKVDTGSGNDTLYIKGHLNSNSEIKAGYGENDIYIGGDANAKIKSGNNDDSVYIGGNLNSNSKIETEKGNDQIFIGGNVNTTIDTDKGNDVIHIKGAVNSNGEISTKDDNDTVVVEGHIDGTVKLGKGSDVLVVGGHVNGVLDGEDGTDYLYLSSLTVSQVQQLINNDRIKNFENIKAMDGVVQGADFDLPTDTQLSAMEDPFNGSTSQAYYQVSIDVSDLANGETLSSVDVFGVPTGAKLQQDGVDLSVNADGSYTVQANGQTSIDNLTVVSNSDADIDEFDLVAQINTDGVNDDLAGTSVDSAIVGSNGDEYLEGTSGEDTLFGNSGDDVLFGGDDSASDTMVGGEGNDIFILAKDSSVSNNALDLIQDFDADDDALDVSDLFEVNEGDDIQQLLADNLSLTKNSDGSGSLMIKDSSGNDVEAVSFGTESDLSSNEITVIFNNQEYVINPDG